MMEIVLAVVYALASWWAFGVLFEGSTLFGTMQGLFFIKWLMPLAFGFILIPIAIIKRILQSVFG